MEQNIDPMDAKQNKAMGVLAYLGILCLIPILAAPDSKFARFHANQGLVLLIFEAAYKVITKILSQTLFSILWPVSFLGNILDIAQLAFLVFVIIGIVNASNGEAKELPIIGSIRIIK